MREKKFNQAQLTIIFSSIHIARNCENDYLTLVGPARLLANASSKNAGVRGAVAAAAAAAPLDVVVDVVVVARSSASLLPALIVIFFCV